MGRFLDKGYLIALMVSVGLAAAYTYHRDLPAQFQFYEENEAYTATLQQEYENAVVAEQDLVTRVDGLERDPIEMEEAIRHQKQLARPGEKVFRIQPAPSAQ